MRPITGADIVEFHDGRADLLVLTADGEFTTIDQSDVVVGPARWAASYDDVVTGDGAEAQVLLTRADIDDGDRFPDALDGNGHLSDSVADEMAGIINADGILPGRVRKAVEAGEAWRKATEAADRLAMERAAAVAEVVAYCGGNQSHAARTLGLDQSTVNKLVKKARTGTES